MLTINQLEAFRSFCYYEKLTGGPDPHMRAVVELSKDLSAEEQLWRAALYVGVYNVPTAEAIWRHFSAATVLDMGVERFPRELETWLTTNWAGIQIRRERRTSNSPTKIANYVTGYWDTVREQEHLKTASLEDLWGFAMSLPRVGRYAATKFVEIWHRMGLTMNTHADIRARGGWSPRTALQLIYPSLGNPYNDSPQAVEDAEHAAAVLLKDLVEHGTQLTPFELEVMLCEHKASWSTRRQYPGRSLDSELKYELAVRPHWGIVDTEHMAVRPKLSPQWALGEYNGWDGPRDGPANVLADFGYVWSDQVYDYMATIDFAHPVKK